MCNWQLHTPGFAEPVYSDLASLVTLNLRDCTMWEHPKLPSSLRSLDLSGATVMVSRPSESVQVMQALDSSELEVLKVGRSYVFSSTVLERLLTLSTTKLTTLVISHCPGSYQAAIRTCLSKGSFRCIVELEVAGLGLDDDDMALLAENAPRMKHLDVGHTKITGIGVKALVTKAGTSLEWLGLDGCTLVSLDAVQLARKAGITVRYNLATSEKTLRRSRQV